MTVAIAVLAAVVAVRLVLDLAAHVSRYRRYRRTYPAANPGRVWAHTADRR